MQPKVDAERLTKMVHNSRLAPLPGRLLVRGFEHAGIQEQIINLAAGDTVQRLLSKSLDRFQVGQLEGQYGHGIGRLVVLKTGNGITGGFDVSRSEDDFVRGGLLQELFQHFQALISALVCIHVYQCAFPHLQCPRRGLWRRWSLQQKPLCGDLAASGGFVACWEIYTFGQGGQQLVMMSRRTPMALVHCHVGETWISADGLLRIHGR